MVSGINTGYYGYQNNYNNLNTQNAYQNTPYLIDMTGIYPTTSTNQQQSGIATGTDTNAADGKNDGKIGFWKAAGHLLKGALKFVTSPFTDEQGNFSLGKTFKSALTAVGIAALTAVPVIGPLVVPTMLAAGITFGTLGAARAVGNILTAETDAEDIAAWESLGGNAAAVGLSIYGAKKYASAKAGHDVSVKESVKQVFKEPKDAIVNGYRTVKNASVGQIAEKVGVDKLMNRINTAAAETEVATTTEAVAETTNAAATVTSDVGTTTTTNAAAEATIKPNGQVVPKKPLFADTREKIVSTFENNKDKTLAEIASKIFGRAKESMPAVSLETVKNNKVPFAIGTLYMVGRTDVRPDFYHQLTPAEQRYYDQLPDSQKRALLEQYYAA